MMRYVAVIIGGLAFAASDAVAEPPARFENAILYSYLKADTPVEQSQDSFHSYRLSYTYFLNKHVGLGGDLIQAGKRNDDLLVGPEVSLLDKGRIRVRLIGRLGWVRRLYLDPPTGGTRQGWHFAGAVASSVDVSVWKGISWRAVQPEVLWWSRDGSHTDFRISTGAVLRFGKLR